MSDIFDTKTYNISEFIKWQTSNELNLSPKFQRNSVWNDQAKSYLIDSIIRGLPIPPVFIRQKVDVAAAKIFREVIDGQQRLRAILDYYDGKFAVKGPFAEIGYRNKKYEELSDELKQNFLEYDIATQIVKSKPDSIIYDMFARLNTNNMVLNKQELRNAKFWGLFKGLIYEMGREFKELSISWKIFTDKDFSRMRDYELINSLVIYLIDGVRSETPAIVDTYYKNHEEKFDNLELYLNRFLEIIQKIKTIYDNGYVLTYFNRPRYFYTLFVCFDKFQKHNNKWPNYNDFIPKISLLENALESDEYSNDVSDLAKIKEYHLVRTTNAKERNIRIDAVYKAIFE